MAGTVTSSPFTGPQVPDRIYMVVKGLNYADARDLAHAAVLVAQHVSPKLSTASSGRFEPIWGDDYFGVRWVDRYVWSQERGIRAFTMRRLAGKTVPMWIDDPTGQLRRENPRAQTRLTASGRAQTLIFRRAAREGQRKTVVRDGVRVDVPASYPGAPGRIALREARRPWTSAGRVGGRIARGNVGVRWRHPGLTPRGFLRRGLMETAARHGIPPGPILASLGAVQRVRA